MKPKPYNRSKRYLLELSRSQLLIGLVGLLLILCVVFVLGIFVGQGYVSETITRAFTEKIQKLEQEKKEWMEKYLAMPQTSGHAKEEVVEPRLDFYRELPGKGTAPHEEFIPKPTPPSPSGSAADKIPPVQTPGESLGREKASTQPLPPASAKAEAVPKKGRPDPKIETKETKTPQVKQEAGPTALVVQVGAYRDESAARALAKRLTAKGYPVRVQGKDLPEKGGKWYRVQIGPYPNRFEAERTVIRLDHDGFRGVVVENR